MQLAKALFSEGGQYLASPHALSLLRKCCITPVHLPLLPHWKRENPVKAALCQGRRARVVQCQEADVHGGVLVVISTVVGSCAD